MAASALSMHGRAVIFEGEDPDHPSTSPTGTSGLSGQGFAERTFFFKTIFNLLVKSLFKKKPFVTRFMFFFPDFAHEVRV